MLRRLVNDAILKPVAADADDAIGGPAAGVDRDLVSPPLRHAVRALLRAGRALRLPHHRAGRLPQRQRRLAPADRDLDLARALTLELQADLGPDHRLVPAPGARPAATLDHRGAARHGRNAAGRLDQLDASPIRRRSAFSAWVLFFHNTFQTLQDVSTDAMAMDLLPPSERGRMNGFMWASKLVATSLGGIVLATVLVRWGLPLGVRIQAGLVLAIMLLPLFIRERAGEKLFPWSPGRRMAPPGASVGVAGEAVGLRRAVGRTAAGRARAVARLPPAHHRRRPGGGLRHDHLRGLPRRAHARRVHPGPGLDRRSSTVASRAAGVWSAASSAPSAAATSATASGAD